MPAQFDIRDWDVAALGEAWRRARPFPHLLIDDLLAPDALLALQAAQQREGHLPNQSELYHLLGSAEVLVDPVLQDFVQSLARPEVLSRLGAITGESLTSVDGRSYVYLPGHYLLPHSDWRPDDPRKVAYAFYSTPPPGCAGGELLLYDCDRDAGGIVATRPGAQIAQRANRLVLFAVDATTLHEVREVLAGTRTSIAGWFR